MDHVNNNIQRKIVVKSVIKILVEEIDHWVLYYKESVMETNYAA